MITKYDDRGNFDDFLPHELLVHLVRSSFNGSIELQYEGQSRSLHFSSGRLTSAASTFHGEQVDKLIERSISTTLGDEEREALLDMVKEGHKYGQAVVEAGILSAGDLLKYSDEQARLICRNALSETPLRYDIRELEQPAHSRPLQVDLIEIVYKSLTNDVSEETVKEQLGADESTVFMPSEHKKISSPAIMQNPELQTVLNHLDGRRTVSELRKRVGFNPERTARALLFLRIIDWIEPVMGNSGAYMESPADIAAVTTGAYKDPEPGKADTEEDEGILKLLDDDSVQLEGEPAFSAGKDVSSSKDEPDTIKAESPFSSMLDSENEEETTSLVSLLLRPIPLAIAGSLLVLVILYFAGVFTPVSQTEETEQPETPPAETLEEQPQDLSFYDETVDEEQLPITEDFGKERSGEISAVKIDKDDLRQDEEQASQPEEESGESGDQEEKTQTNPQPVDEVNSEPAENEKTATGQRLETNENEEEQTRSEPFARIQTRALELILSSGWQQASETWKASLKAHHADQYTLSIYTAASEANLAGVFERFANSVRLRNGFFAISQPTGNYRICWGLFATPDEALAAMESLPARISEYSPSLTKVESVIQ